MANGKIVNGRDVMMLWGHATPRDDDHTTSSSAAPLPILLVLAFLTTLFMVLRGAAVADETPHHDVKQFVVHSTWNESRNDEFPQVLLYRQKWKNLGFSIQLTPNEDIRNDITTLHELEPSLKLLEMFDGLDTTNMKFDVWRYTKLYLEGGIYADVDVEPLEGVQRLASLAESSNKPILFEESNWPSNIVTQTLIPLVSDYNHLPAYGTCLVISPMQPRNVFFLQLLREMNPSQWKDVAEPTRTLMTVGPGFVTKFINEHPASSIFLIGYKERALIYIHHGFGTWKSWLPKEFVFAGKGIMCITILILVWRFKRRWKRRRKHDATKYKPKTDTREETAPLLDGLQLRKRHNHSPETVEM